MPESIGASAVLYGAGCHRLEGAAGNELELVQVSVVPARVGGAADEPAAAVVGDEHPVLLQRGEDGQRGAVVRRQVERRLETESLAHGWIDGIRHSGLVGGGMDEAGLRLV